MEVYRLKCANGLLIVYEDRVVISRNTVMGYLAQGFKGDRTFYYKDLTSVEYRKPTIWANGYMKFIAPGTRDVDQSIPLGAMSTPMYAVRDGNSVILRAFRKSVPIHSEKIYNYIMQRLEECKKLAESNSSTISKADEIAKFKKLLDDGAITQEEFEKKKQELLK